MKLELTKKELSVLLFALGNTTQYDDAMDAVFDKKTDKTACLRAEKKLEEAFRKSHHKRKVVSL